MPVVLPMQVFELQPVLDPHTAWREVSLLRQCAHARIVPLFGVALRVGGRRLWWDRRAT